MHTETPHSATDTQIPELLSIAEAAALLHVTPHTVRSRIRAGLLPARTLAGSRIVRVERRDVLAQWQPYTVGAMSHAHRSASSPGTSPLIDRLSTPEGRARALAALDALTEGDEQEQRDTLNLLARAEREYPLSLREVLPPETGHFE